MYKFLECNQTKKFFRADHFRQYLKHSHAGINRKWTNLLENAYIKEEQSAEVPAGTMTEVEEWDHVNNQKKLRI